jgi:hypothetical protein
MWRVILLLVCVLAVDFALIYFWAGATLDMNMLEISRAVEAREANFSRETQKALEDAQIHEERLQEPWKIGFSAAIVVVTTTGFFVAGRWFERYRKKPPTGSPADATTQT